MSLFRSLVGPALVAGLGGMALLFTPEAAHAQGVVVQDTQAFSQRVSQWAEHLQQLKNQLQQQQMMVQSMTGMGSYGGMAPQSLAALRAVLPDDWGNVYDDAMSSGSQFSGSATNIMQSFDGQTAGMSKLEALNYSMQQMRYKGAYDRAMTQNVYNNHMQELTDLQTLTGQIDETQTEKEAADLQNRIQAQDVAIRSEGARLQMMKMMQDAQSKLYEQQQDQAMDEYFVGDTSTDGAPDFSMGD